VLAQVPQTFPYTMCAGVWRLIQQLDTDKSELNVMLLRRMAPSYHEAIKGRFEYLVPMLMTDQDPEKSFFLSHNGITNLISPLWRLVEEGQAHHVPRILRALFTFETFQVMRRFCRQKDARFYIEQLDRLLGVNFDKRGTRLPEMFCRSDPNHFGEVELNEEFFAELRNALNHVKYATLIVPLFKAVRHEDPVGQTRAIPQVSDETLAKAMELEYPLEEFILYNMVEGYLYQQKQDRVDKDTTKSLRPDLGVRSVGQTLCREYISGRYAEDYDYRLKQMAGEEKKELCDRLIDDLVNLIPLLLFAKS